MSMRQMSPSRSGMVKKNRFPSVDRIATYRGPLFQSHGTDDRVVPMHSFKFGAALQRAQAGDAPILLRIETRAGHGAGTPVTKQIELATDRWAYLVKTLNMDVPQY